MVMELKEALEKQRSDAAAREDQLAQQMQALAERRRAETSDLTRELRALESQHELENREISSTLQRLTLEKNDLEDTLAVQRRAAQAVAHEHKLELDRKQHVAEAKESDLTRKLEHQRTEATERQRQLMQQLEESSEARNTETKN